MRAQGNGFGITGWSIGVGWTVLVNPIMFEKLENRTYFLFAGLNLLWIPIVYLCKLVSPSTKTTTKLDVNHFRSNSLPRDGESIT